MNHWSLLKKSQPSGQVKFLSSLSSYLPLLWYALILSGFAWEWSVSYTLLDRLFSISWTTIRKGISSIWLIGLFSWLHKFFTPFSIFLLARYPFHSFKSGSHCYCYTPDYSSLTKSTTNLLVPDFWNEILEKTLKKNNRNRDWSIRAVKKMFDFNSPLSSLIQKIFPSLPSK